MTKTWNILDVLCLTSVIDVFIEAIAGRRLTRECWRHLTGLKVMK